MNHPQDKPLVLAAPAPEIEDEEAEGAALSAEEVLREARADELFQAYAHWCRTRGFYGPPPVNTSLLGKLSSKVGLRPQAGGPDAHCSAELSALHIAVIAQPADSLDRKVFSLHYLYNVRSVKEAAHLLGVSRAHWYRLLKSFRERVTTSSRAILEDNNATRDNLPHLTGKRPITDDAD